MDPLLYTANKPAEFESCIEVPQGLFVGLVIFFIFSNVFLGKMFS